MLRLHNRIGPSMSRFVDNLRSLLSRHFDIRDESLGEEVISVWKAMGIDVTRSRPLTIHVMLPSEDAAMELAFRLETLPAFAGARVSQVSPQNGLTFELAASFDMLPDARALDTLDRLIAATGADLDAQCDGWSAAPLEGETFTKAA